MELKKVYELAYLMSLRMWNDKMEEFRKTGTERDKKRAEIEWERVEELRKMIIEEEEQ